MPSAVPSARGGQRAPLGAGGPWAMAGDTTHLSQSLTSAHPSAGRIQMSALLINTSDFNLRSHGIALSSPRSRLQRQFCLQPAQPAPCPRLCPLLGALCPGSGAGDDPAVLRAFPASHRPGLAHCPQFFWGNSSRARGKAAHPSGYWLPAILSALPKTKAQLKHFSSSLHSVFTCYLTH